MTRSEEIVPSVALGALITLTRRFKQANRRLILAAVQKSLRETLAVCNLDKLFEIYDTSEDALGRLLNS